MSEMSSGTLSHSAINTISGGGSNLWYPKIKKWYCINMTQIGSIFRSPIWTYLFLNGVSFPVSSPVAAAAIAASSNKNGRSVSDALRTSCQLRRKSQMSFFSYRVRAWQSHLGNGWHMMKQLHQQVSFYICHRTFFKTNHHSHSEKMSVSLEYISQSSNIIQPYQTFI